MKLFTIPNLLTLGNLFCGCLALWIIFGLDKHLDLLNFLNNSTSILEYENNTDLYIKIILGLISLSLFFDLLDGMVARAMKINSEIGIQLDSLADMVSFGVTPGFMMFIMLQNNSTGTLAGFIGFLGLFITLFSALRLAKFNVDTEQTTFFKGLATPANTILIFSLFWLYVQNGKIISPELDLYLLIATTLFSCGMLVANIPLFSFKFKGFAWKDNHYKYLFLIISIILLVFFQMTALPFIILLYIITSLIFRKNIVHA